VVLDAEDRGDGASRFDALNEAHEGAAAVVSAKHGLTEGPESEGRVEESP
jgi:hypothetical protein